MDIQGLISHWLNDHKDVLSIRALEKELGMPPDTLQKIMQGNRKLPQKWTNPFINYIDKFTGSWQFPQKYRKYLEHEGEDFFEYIELKSRFDRSKRKKRLDYIPNFDDILNEFNDATWNYSRYLSDIIKLVNELQPRVDNKMLMGLNAVNKRTIELSELLKALQFRGKPLEQTTELY